ncbi:hypothetical protein BBJ28_00003871 [Nothophytophthora sp. Chile5]|nr:hypothetical protein BBJ28_00003871 [Nothophytophthora sp. Chile5]
MTQAECLAMWKAARAGDDAKLQEQLEESDAVARNLVNWVHHRKGTTPLMEAAACRRGEAAVGKLIAAGADVNAFDNTKLKNTALHYAAMTNRDRLSTETLLEAGADAFAVNRKGLTPLDIARQYGRRVAGGVLLEHMKVHSGWLFLRGKFRWKKRWGVVVACNKQRTSTELCVFHRPGDLRPDFVMLIDEAAKVALFPSTDSFSWLKRENAFVFDKPVMCHRVKQHKFTRSPICRKTMSLEDVQTRHLVFAADSYNNLSHWRRVLQSSNFYVRETGSPVYQAPLFEAPNGELYYWPHELVENLRSSMMKEQEQQREAADDPLFQRLRATLEQRRSQLAEDLQDELVQEPPPRRVQSPPPPTQNEVEELEELPPNFQRRGETEPSEPERRERNRVHFTSPQPPKHIEVPLAAQQQYIGGPAMSSASVTSGSDSDSVGPEFATGMLLLTDTGSRGSPREGPPQRPQEQQQEQEQKRETTQERQQPSVSQVEGEREQQQSPPDEQEENHLDLCGMCDVAPRNAICTPCGHQAGCIACLQTIMHTSRVCPLCRARIRSILKVGD